MNEDHPALIAARSSWRCVQSHNRNGWLELMADDICVEARGQGYQRFGRAGYDQARWILLDYVDVVVHIFDEEYREYYDLELLWGDATRIDWAHDSAWRFMPLVHDPLGGFLLHPVDLAINKLLALAGRDEARDFVDILFVHGRVLAIPALCWAAVGKDPGLTPLSLLELLRRRGRYRPEDFTRLQLAEPFDLVRAKGAWRAALEDADAFVRARPADEYGCLYCAVRDERFVMPRADADLAAQGIVPHFGAPGGVVPRVADARIEDSDLA